MFEYYEIEYASSLALDCLLGFRRVRVRRNDARHADALERCRKELDDLLAGMDAGLSGDLLAFHLRQGISQLGRITGEIDADEVLGSIFSSFCIGK